MMQVLLDTHALLFWLFDDPRLSDAARSVIADPNTAAFVSAASSFEIHTKQRLGKLTIADALVSDLSGWVRKAGFRELPMTVEHAAQAGSWPHPHRDPFDRILAAQASLEQMPLVTRDEALRSFGVPLVW